MVELHYSRFRLVLGVLVMLGFCIAVGLWGLGAFASGQAQLRLTAAICCPPLLLFTLLSLWPLLRAWPHKGPALIMDGEGVTDLRQSRRFVAWKDIETVGLGLDRSANYLYFLVRDAARERGEVPERLGLLKRLRRLIQDDIWNVDLRLIAGNRHQILQQARQMRMVGVRQHALRTHEKLPSGAPASAAAADETRREH